jgi:FkbM family methyltransferase
MKQIIKGFLGELGLWYHIQWSTWYLKFKNPKFLENLVQDKKFYETLIGNSNKLIIDIGANVGNKTLVFSQLARTVVCVDPDRENFRILKSRFGKNSSIRIINKAVGEQITELTFHSFSDKDAYNTLSTKQKEIVSTERGVLPASSYQVQVTTLQNIIEEFGIPDYVKIDVEGFEKNVIEGLKVNIPLLSIEANLPNFLEETIWCVNYLDSMAKGKAKFNYAIAHQLEFAEYISAKQMIDFLKETQLGYMEVYCKTDC